MLGFAPEVTFNPTVNFLTNYPFSFGLTLFIYLPQRRKTQQHIYYHHLLFPKSISTNAAHLVKGNPHQETLELRFSKLSKCFTTEKTEVHISLVIRAWSLV